MAHIAHFAIDFVTVNGQQFVERLEAVDDSKRLLRYTNVAGMAVSHFTGTLEVKPKGSGCLVDWRAQFLATNATDRAVKVKVSTQFKTGLESLKQRFGIAK